MSSVANSKVKHLPVRFPVGTRYIIEGHGGIVDQRYLEFPDGQKVDLTVERTGRSYPRGDGRLSPVGRTAAGRKN
jgi:hypothetical protein